LAGLRHSLSIWRPANAEGAFVACGPGHSLPIALQCLWDAKLGSALLRNFAAVCSFGAVSPALTLWKTFGRAARGPMAAPEECIANQALAPRPMGGVRHIAVPVLPFCTLGPTSRCPLVFPPRLLSAPPSPKPSYPQAERRCERAWVAHSRAASSRPGRRFRRPAVQIALHLLDPRHQPRSCPCPLVPQPSDASISHSR
jgi:hypothetical protein